MAQKNNIIHHFSINLIAFLVLGIFSFSFFIGEAKADTHTWDGGGADDNWSTCANWNVSDTCPDSDDTVTFDGTSTKNSTIDAGFGGTVATFNINAGYSGIITQSRSLIINGAFAQSAGTFQGGVDSLDFNNMFTLNSGATFISTSGTAYFANTFTIAEGAGSNAWQHNNGTVVCDATNARAWQLDGTNAEADETFYNFQIDATSNLNLTPGEIIVIAGTSTLTNGAFNNGTMSAQGAVSVTSAYDRVVAKHD